MKLVFSLFVLLLVTKVKGQEQEDVYRNSKQFKSQNMHPINMTDWGLLTEEEYPGVVEITNKNFKKVVITSQDVWILVVYKDNLPVKWSEHAKRVKGSAFYGKINFDEERQLVTELDADLEGDDIRTGVAFIFPFGTKTSKSIKNFWPKKTRRALEAEKVAAGSFKNMFERFDFQPQNMERFNQWMIKAFYKSNPSKFPVICLTDSDDNRVPLPFLAISYYFDSHFSFGIAHRDDFPNLQRQIKQIPNPTNYPSLFIMLGKEPSQEEMKSGEFGMSFNILPYLEQKYGMAENFISLVKYLFITNEDYRKYLPGRNPNEPEDTTAMRNVMRSLNKRISKIKRNTKQKIIHMEL